MKNTLEKGRIRFLIYGSPAKKHYTGICYELGLVEEGNSVEEVKHRLINGTVAIVQTVTKEKMPLDCINMRPALKYTVIFYFFAIISVVTYLTNFLRESFTLKIFDENLSDLKAAC